MIRVADGAVGPDADLVHHHLRGLLAEVIAAVASVEIMAEAGQVVLPCRTVGLIRIRIPRQGGAIDDVGLHVLHRLAGQFLAQMHIGAGLEDRVRRGVHPGNLNLLLLAGRKRIHKGQLVPCAVAVHVVHLRRHLLPGIVGHHRKRGIGHRPQVGARQHKLGVRLVGIRRIGNFEHQILIGGRTSRKPQRRKDAS